VRLIRELSEQGLQERPPVLENEIKAAHDLDTPPVFKTGENLEFENVCVYRPDGTLLIKDLNLKVVRGSRVLITGGNGWYVDICIHIYMYTFICTYVHVYMYICIYMYIHIHVWNWILRLFAVCTFWSLVEMGDICIFAYIYTSIYICKHKYVFIHVCIYMNLRVVRVSQMLIIGGNWWCVMFIYIYL